MNLDFMKNMPRPIFELPPEDQQFEEQMQFLADQCLPGLLGIKLTKINQEQSEGYVDYHKTTTGLHGLMHGGTIFSAGDTLTAMMLLTFGDDTFENVLTTGASIRYLRPVGEGRINLRARVTSRKGDNFTLVTDFLNDKGKRVAQGKYNYLMIRASKAS